MGDSAKAEELLQAAAKKRQSGGGFFSFLANPTGKLEEACDMYTQAGNIFKINKKWDEAGKAFCEAAACQIQLKADHEAASKFVDAANCYKKSNQQEAVRCLENAVQRYSNLGRFAIAAKHLMTVAELYETQIVDMEKAMANYQKAADYFQGEDSQSSANKALLKVATLSATLEDYDRAIEIFEEVAIAMLDNSLLKWSAKENFFKAGICRLCSGDTVAAQKHIERYESICAGFRDTRESKLCKGILGTLEEGDVDEFTSLVQDFDAVSTLDPWFTTLLLRIKKSMTTDELN